MIRLASFGTARRYPRCSTRNVLQFTVSKAIDISTQYERKTPLEHVLLRPGMYIGQTSMISADMWLYNGIEKAMKKSTIQYMPALLKLFDEILVNAADNKQRAEKMTKIDVQVKLLPDHQFEVSVFNDGKGIPTDLHEKEKLHIPELIFGHLMTGSNFNDDQSRLTGGSHGYGAKLTNIFSTSFTVETFNIETGILYRQNWSRNMSKVSPPKITPIAGVKSKKHSFTKVTFRPDLERLGLYQSTETLEDKQRILLHLLQMFQRRVLDIGACTTTKVSFAVTNSVGDDNEMDKIIESLGDFPVVKSFEDYVKLFYSNGGDSNIAAEPEPSETLADDMINTPNEDNKFVYAKVNPRWEIAVGPSATGTFESIAFVNNVWTGRGGGHVNLVTQQVVKAVEKALDKRNVSASAAIIKNNLSVFVNCLIENPHFDSQTKDALASKPVAFGSTCQLSDALLKKIIRDTSIIDNIVHEVSARERSKYSNKSTTKKRIVTVPKLEDAHDAGGEHALDCTLILTEGDSAKALAVAGLEVVGRERFGVMPIRGKIINVSGMTTAQMLKNEEFVNLCKALGLDLYSKYEDGLSNAGLRYGKVLIMCDQDNDGSHIKGLLINIFHKLWPELLRHEGFLQQFITPIVKLRSTGKKRETMSFYSINEYKKWIEQSKESKADDALRSYSVKYYKGLGTNTAQEGREYFQALDQHRKVFRACDSTDSHAITLAFDKEKVSDRKDWLLQKSRAGQFTNASTGAVQYKDFVHSELLEFGLADLQRSIPSVIDGLKPSQRKVLYGCFKRKLIKEEAKVVQIAGYIAEQTAYHHGEVSLHNTIINMAQDYVGANNVPFLVAAGQFGTRAQGGKDSASPRYVFTRLSPLTRLIFPEEDDSLLIYEEEDGMQVEPKYYIPIVPTILLNGITGIGTGWSTFVPPYHLPHLIERVSSKIRGVDVREPLKPHIVGFAGEIHPVQSIDGTIGSYRTKGIIRQKSATQVEITELPYGVWTDDYKKWLTAHVESGLIKDFKEFHSTDRVRFEIDCSKALMDTLHKRSDVYDALESFFKLTSSFSIGNMHAFDRNNVIMKYDTPEQIVDAHYDIRLEAYHARKAALERKFASEELRSRNRSEFINSIVRGDIDILSPRIRSGQKGGLTGAMAENLVIDKLRTLNFATESDIKRVLDGTTPTTTSATVAQEHANCEVNAQSFSYLLEMPIQSLTEERALQLQTRAAEARERLDSISRRSAPDLWLEDLSKLSDAYENLRTK